MTIPEGLASATDFLSTLVGKPVVVMLAGGPPFREPDLLSGILTSVYRDAILLTRQSNVQLIYVHAVAMIQETNASERPFLAAIATVQASASSSGNDLPAKYIGE
jgi:hypothetical protein